MWEKGQICVITGNSRRMYQGPFHHFLIGTVVKVHLGDKLFIVCESLEDGLVQGVISSDLALPNYPAGKRALVQRINNSLIESM